MRYYLIAGEASGDLHGSNLIKGLTAEDPDARLRFWGGDLMREAAGDRGELARHYREGAVMGFTEVISKGFKLLGNVKSCKKDILDWKPDVVILIDYPGFNMKIASFCHSRGIKVFYYIAPKTWASRESRNRRLKDTVDRLFIVFPFEIPYFTSRQIPFIYEGNPLIDAIDGHRYERPVDGRYIALLAGSRKAEISRMMPVYMELVDRMGADPAYSDYRFVIAAAPSTDMEEYLRFTGGRENVTILPGRTYDILKFADAAAINSGTASLEAVLTGTPQVVGWNTSALTFFVAKHILKVGDHIKYISLGNLCIDKPVFRELLQDDLNVDTLFGELDRILTDTRYRERMLEDYGQIRKSLGGSGASHKIARAMINELSGR